MGPVDVRTAFALMHWPGGTHDKDRSPVYVGVVDRHLGMQHTDQIVQDHAHRFAGRSGVPVGDLYRYLFVLADHQLWVICAIVDDRVVEATETCARVHRDMFDTILL